MPNERKACEQVYRRYLSRITALLGNGSTTTSVLAGHLRRLVGSRNFGGVFARDEFDHKTLRPGQVAIVNTDTSKSATGGTHWVGVGMSKTEAGLLHVYDSFGRHDVLGLGFTRKWKDTEDDAEQAEKEGNCGQRSLAWCCIFVELGERAAHYI